MGKICLPLVLIHEFYGVLCVEFVCVCVGVAGVGSRWFVAKICLLSVSLSLCFSVSLSVSVCLHVSVLYFLTLHAHSLIHSLFACVWQIFHSVVPSDFIPFKSVQISALEFFQHICFSVSVY